MGLFSELTSGIFAGVGIHLAILLYQISRPKVVVEVRQTSATNTPYIYILRTRPSSSLPPPSSGR